jgi:dTDP-4-dehydrorhamnose 3,5-epimerase
MHVLRADQQQFQGFGEVYFSTVKRGAIKAWKLHTRMTMNVIVPVGRVHFVLYDAREESPTKGNIQEVVIGQDNYALLTVAPGIWNGFRGESDEISFLVNCSDILFDPDEGLRRDVDDPSIPYRWIDQ